MLTGLIIVATGALLAVLSHRHDRLSNKIWKNVPINEWMGIAVFPVFLYVGWAIIIKNILLRPNVGIFFLDDIDIFSVMLLSLIYGYVAVALHFGSKVIWIYLKGNKKSMAYKVNEMFHGKMSHYLGFLNLLFVLFTLSLLELNHPMQYFLFKSYLMYIVLSGIVCGLATSKAIFYTNEWFGGYNKPLFFISIILLSILVAIFKTMDLSYVFYPVSAFIHTFYISMILTILIRQILIFSKLPAKGKLRFLSKIMSV